VQKVVQAYQAVEAAKAMAEFRQKEFERIKQLADNKAVSAELVTEKEKQLVAAKAQLAAAEAEVAYLVGKPPGGRRALAKDLGATLLDNDGDGRLDVFIWGHDLSTARDWDRAAGAPKAATGPTAEKLRKALDQPLSLHLNDEPLSKLLKVLKDACPEVHLELGDVELHRKVSVHWENLSLAAVLQYVEDLHPGYRWVVRDYGLLLRNSGTLPPGALLLDDFRKGLQQADGRHCSASAKAVNGSVEAVEEKSGMLKLSVGSDAGLTKGQVLEVYRLEKGAQPAVYLGQVRVVEVTPTTAAAQRLGNGARFGAIQVGDRVSDRITER
jgi:hypothetical protein